MKKKNILFFNTTTASVIIYKIAREFRKYGWETILVTISDKERFDESFHKKAYDKMYCSNFQFSKSSLLSPKYLFKKSPNLIKFMSSVRKLNPDVVIGTGNHWQLKLFHQLFLKKFPFIFFPYDILSQYMGREGDEGPKQIEIDAEKYCFEKADGVIHKGAPDELKYFDGKNLRKMELPELQLSFLPYCSEEFIIPLNRDKLSKKDKEPHLVFVGMFFQEPSSKEKLRNIFQKILEQNIHIHTYNLINHVSEEEEEKYVEGAYKPFLNNPYFHIHNPLPQKEFIKETSRYDFGLWVVEIGGNHLRFSTGNKISSFLEAGLPLIYDDKMVYLDRLMNSYGLGFPINEENAGDLKKRIKGLSYRELEEKIVRARKDYLIEKHFPRLMEFIEKVISKKHKSFYKP